MKKGVKMVDMSIHDVSGVVGWCLGAYSKVENTCVHHLHTFLHTGSGLYNPLQQTRIVSRPHILYNISTTLYNTLQSTALQQFYSLQPLQHPSGAMLKLKPRNMHFIKLLCISSACSSEAVKDPTARENRDV